ncbi:MAG TPA: anti-sigma factor [Gammaproteobacteria bacterium]|nr:anti-sigma factor [Gammaproteobacteria bacterium]
MTTSETTATKSSNKKRLPLWFWILISFLTALGVVSFALYLIKYTQLTIAAQKDQTPLILQRNILLQQSDILQSNWLKTLNPLAKKIQGDLIWSNQQQKGFMRFANLPKLSSGQIYHLWVYDLEQDLKKPISATQFQSEPHAKKEFLVEIVPEKIVKKPYKFILNLETEGEAEQVLLLAQP